MKARAAPPLGRGGSDYTTAFTGRSPTRNALISGPMFPASTRPIHAWFRLRSVLMKSPLKRPRKWRPLARKCCIRLAPVCQPYVAIFRVFVGSSKGSKRAVRWYVIKPRIHRCSGRWHYAVSRRLLTLHSLNMLHSRGFLAEVFGIWHATISRSLIHHIRSQRGADAGYHWFNVHRRYTVNTKVC